MSPRGVPIPDVRRRLFDAAERILERGGPDELTSRAITAEAGTATGVLFRHFGDLNDFLAAFVLDQLERVREVTRGWAALAGTRTLAENLTDAAMSIVPTASLLVDLVHTRPSLATRLIAERHGHAAGIDEIERSFATYLEAERALGRVAAETDIEAIALALAASVHQLSLRHERGDRDVEKRITRVVAALASEISV